MNFISEDFHLHYVSSYSLYIQSDFLYTHLVVLGENNEVMVFLKYASTQPTTEALRFLSYPFTKVIVGLPHQRLIWVPSAVFKPAEKEIYLPYFENDSLESISTKDVSSWNTVALYQFDQVLWKQWKKVFPKVRFVPNFEVFVQQSDAYLQGKEVIAVHIYDQRADIFLVVNNEFKLYNSFEVVTPDDLCYFVLNIMRTFALTENVQRIVLSGAGADSDWSESLKKYCDELLLLNAKTDWSCADPNVNKEISSLNLLADSGLCVL